MTPWEKLYFGTYCKPGFTAFSSPVTLSLRHGIASIILCLLRPVNQFFHKQFPDWRHLASLVYSHLALSSTCQSQMFGHCWHDTPTAPPSHGRGSSNPTDLSLANSSEDRLGEETSPSSHTHTLTSREVPIHRGSLSHESHATHWDSDKKRAASKISDVSDLEFFRWSLSKKNPSKTSPYSDVLTRAFPKVEALILPRGKKMSILVRYMLYSTIVKSKNRLVRALDVSKSSKQFLTWLQGLKLILEMHQKHCFDICQ